MKRFKESVLVVISAALLVIPYHFPETFFIAFFAFAPYFFAIKDKFPSQCLKASYLLGILYFAGVGYWLSLVNVFGNVLLTAYLALYFGAFGYLSCHFISSRNVRGIFYAAAIWTILEYVRGWMISGLPWALLSYSQWRHLPFIQVADVIGAFGVSFLVCAINLSLFKIAILWPGQRKKSIGIFLALAAAIALITVYGWQRMNTLQASSGNERRLRIAVVQGNIPQDQKWNSKIKSIIFEKYKRLTFMSALEKADLIIWPETSFPGYLEDEPVLASRLRSMVRGSKADVLVGAPTMGNLNEGLKFYNSAILFGASGEEKKRYNKIHLVPFGEYVPFQPLIGWIRKFVEIGHFTPGDERVIFVAESHHQDKPVKARFAVLICFEDIFPGLVRDFSSRGVDFLVNITNDAWFGKTPAPYQHAAASVFRAIENRTPVIRAANTGLSGFIGPDGQLLATVKEKGEEIFVTGQVSYELILRKTGSFYSRFGDVFFFITIFLCYIAYRERKKQTVSSEF